MLVDAAARHVADEDVARAVVGSLWALSVHDPLVPNLVKLGCVQSVIGVAKASAHLTPPMPWNHVNHM